MRTWEVWVIDKVHLHGRDDPEPFDQTFTVQARSAAAAMEAVRDSGVAANLIINAVCKERMQEK